jgi:hypothetical protein
MKIANPHGLGINVGSTTQVTSSSVTINPKNPVAVQNIVKNFSEQTIATNFETKSLLKQIVSIIPESANALPKSQYQTPIKMFFATTSNTTYPPSTVLLNSVKGTNIIFNGVNVVSIDELTVTTPTQIKYASSTYYIFGIKTCEKGSFEIVPLNKSIFYTTPPTTYHFYITPNGNAYLSPGNDALLNIIETDHIAIITNTPSEILVCCSCNNTVTINEQPIIMSTK